MASSGVRSGGRDCSCPRNVLVCSVTRFVVNNSVEWERTLTGEWWVRNPCAQNDCDCGLGQTIAVAHQNVPTVGHVPGARLSYTGACWPLVKCRELRGAVFNDVVHGFCTTILLRWWWLLLWWYSYFARVSCPRTLAVVRKVLPGSVDRALDVIVVESFSR